MAPPLPILPHGRAPERPRQRGGGASPALPRPRARRSVTSGGFPMPMRTHELHPSLVHAPLALLPMTAFVDVAAAMRPRDRRLDRFGARLWWTTAGVALATGLAGMAASQEVELQEDRVRD